MSRKAALLALLVCAAAVISLPAFSQAYALNLVVFKSATVGSVSAVETTWIWQSAGVYVQNDSDATLYILFGAGDVDTSGGAGGGILLPYQGAWFPVKTMRVALKCATGSANVRVWVYRP